MENSINKININATNVCSSSVHNLNTFHNTQAKETKLVPCTAASVRKFSVSFSPLKFEKYLDDDAYAEFDEYGPDSDSPFGLKFGTIIPNPKSKYKVSLTDIMNDNKIELFKKITSPNVDGIINYYVAPSGMHYNQDLLTNGTLPVNLSLLGGHDKLVATLHENTTSQQIYTLGSSFSNLYGGSDWIHKMSSHIGTLSSLNQYDYYDGNIGYSDNPVDPINDPKVTKYYTPVITKPTGSSTFKICLIESLAPLRFIVPNAISNVDYSNVATIDAFGDIFLIEAHSQADNYLNGKKSGFSYFRKSPHPVKIIQTSAARLLVYSDYNPNDDTSYNAPFDPNAKLLSAMFYYAGFARDTPSYGYIKVDGAGTIPLFYSEHDTLNPYMASGRPIVTRNNAGVNSDMKMVAPANTQFGYMPIDIVNYTGNLNHSDTSTTKVSAFGHDGMFSDGYVYYDNFLIGKVSDIQDGYNQQVYYDNNWFQKIGIPTVWKENLKKIWKMFGYYDEFGPNQPSDYEYAGDKRSGIFSPSIPTKIWNDNRNACPYPYDPNGIYLSRLKTAWAWYVDKYLDTFFVYVYHHSSGSDLSSFGSVAPIDHTRWEHPDFRYYYYDHDSKEKRILSRQQWGDTFHLIDRDSNKRPISFFHICDGSSGYKAQYLPISKGNYQIPCLSSAEYKTDTTWRVGYSSLGLLTRVVVNCPKTIGARSLGSGVSEKIYDDYFINRDNYFYPLQESRFSSSINLIPTGGKVLPIPMGITYFVDPTVVASFERYYNPDFSIAYRNPGIKTGHYSDDTPSEPVIVNSAVLLESLETTSELRYTDDYIMSLFLTRDDAIINIISDSNPAKSKEDLIKEIIDDVSATTKSSVDDDKSYLIINDLRDTLNSDDSSISPISHKYDQFGNPHSFNADEFFNYRFVLCGYAAYENPFGVIGHNRVLGTNPQQSPIFNTMIENGIDESKMKYYSNIFSQLASSIYNFDVNAMCDVMDMYNEVSLLSMSVNDQLSTITDSINKISDSLQGDGDDVSDDTKTLIGNFSNVTTDIANNLLDMSTQMEQLLHSANSGSYDDTLLIRNVINTTKYSKDLASAMTSDPYLAVQQHNAYITRRLKTISDKMSLIDISVKFVDGILKLPGMLLKGIEVLSKIVGGIIKTGVKAATATMKVIDNIDKLIFIDETFVSKGIGMYSTIPSFSDNIFNIPQFDPSIGDTSEYDPLIKRAEVPITYDVSPSKFITDKLIELDTSDPIYIQGKPVTYNNYDVSKLISGSNGYYLPKDTSLPILSFGSLGSKLIPNLNGINIQYPHKGHILYHFLRQLSFNDNQSLETINSLSKHIPLTNSMKVAYGWIVAGLSVAAGIAGAMSGLVKGDPIKAIIGGVAAAAAVAAVNGVEMDNIFEKRTSMDENKSVYTYFTANFDAYSDAWTKNHDNIDYLIRNSHMVITNEFIPLYTNASNYKKTFLYIKEAIALIANTISMIAVSYSIGLISGAIVDSARLIHSRRLLAKQRDYENTLALQNKEQINKQFDDNRQEILDRDDLTDEQKKEMIDKLDIDKINYNLYIDGKIKLNGKERWRLNNVLATNYGLPPIATSSSAPSSVSKLVTVGALTSETIKDITDKVNSFNKQLQEDSGLNFDQITQDQEQNNQILNSIVSITTTLSENLVGLIADVKHIKKYI